MYDMILCILTEVDLFIFFTNTILRIHRTKTTINKSTCVFNIY